MSGKSRWSDPANVGQPDYIKVGKKAMFLIVVLVAAAMIKIGIKNNWFGIIRDITGY